MASNADSGDAEFEAQMQALRANFMSSLPTRRAAVTDAWSGCMTGAGEDMWQALRDVAHRLAGSAASYGCDALGEAARELDRLLSRPPPCREREVAAPRVATLVAALDAAIGPG